MANNIRKLGILVVMAAVMLLSIALLALSYSEVGVTDEIWGVGSNLPTYDFSGVPQSVADDAARLASELFDEGEAKYSDFVNQLLLTYMESRDKDFIVVFNSGGWGWNLIDKTPGWNSILSGVKSELDSLGYESVVLNYRRTSETVLGCIEEFVEAVTDYPSKAKELAYRMEFLTDHLPGLRVIVAGESNGTVISDSAMKILRDNPSVYSIQTGAPFWHEPIMLERTLLLNSNGVKPDTFSKGDIPVMLWATLKGLFGLVPPEESPGTVLSFLRAPGHDYSWQYPEIYSQIVSFLDANFGVR
jgi:hypothetical protein